jgi:sugar fermentation stimulation protein A
LDTGAYILLIRVPAERALDIGSLGRLRFPAGNYVYIGSGMGCLSRRVERHFRPDKKVKWHVDRLLGVARLSDAVLFPSKHRDECRLARAVLAFPGARVVPGFGSSDCRCPGHLVFLGALPFGELLGRLERGSKGERVEGRKGTMDGTTRASSPLPPYTHAPFRPSVKEVGKR